MHELAPVFAWVFGGIALAFAALFVGLPGEVRGFVALLVGLAAAAMALVVGGATKTAALAVWTIGAAAIPLLFAVVLFLRLTREERGARRVRIQAILVSALLIGLGVVVGRGVSAPGFAAMPDSAAPAALLLRFDLPVALVAVSVFSMFVVALLAARRRE